MKPTSTALLALLAVLMLPACKIVKNAPEGQSKAELAGEAGDEARIKTLLDQTLESKLLPHIRAKAQPVAELKSAIGAGLEAAGAAHGNRGAGEGAAWNFAVQGSGKVIEANLQSRARKAALDTDGDGKADLTLQLGPVIKGNALRDIAPFYKFNDFRDQIEFAKLGRAINDRVSAALALPEGDILGKTVRFEGAFDVKKPSDAWLVTVTSLAVQP